MENSVAQLRNRLKAIEWDIEWRFHFTITSEEALEHRRLLSEKDAILQEIERLTSVGVTDTEPSKQCPRCDAAFQRSAKSKNPYCPSCYNQYRKNRYANGVGVLAPEQARDAHLQRSYGITAEQYKEMFVVQDGKCAICHMEETRIDPRTKRVKYLHVDHCHETGKVRGLLCSGCNLALGAIKEDPSVAESMIKYIKDKCS